jgi:DNA-binding IclR family transcriptional regulator
MKKKSSNKTEDMDGDGGRGPAGSQTLLRGLDVLEAVIDGAIGINELAERLPLTRSTVHRLASALVDRRYLSFVPREGYRLGSKLLELGYGARQQIDIHRIARPQLEELARQTGHTVHLGIYENSHALYLDKIAGRRRIEISSRVGEMQPTTSTGLGKALILDEDETRWKELWALDNPKARKGVTYAAWRERMVDYAANGYAFDLEENEDRIRCIAAPIRDASGSIVAAISVSSAAQYMSDARMKEMAKTVLAAVDEIGRELGWTQEVGRGRRRN